MSETAKHTPFPWHIVVSADPGREHTPRVCDSYGHCVADARDVVSRGSMRSWDECVANARFIAASPTLYQFVLDAARNGDKQAKETLNSLDLIN